MKRVLLFAVLLFALSACGSAADGPLTSETIDTGGTAGEQIGESTNESSGQTTETAVETASETAEQPPADLALTEPTVAVDPEVIRLDNDLGIETTVYALTADAGTKWELGFHVAVPSGWTYDPASEGFVSGGSSLSFVTGCSPNCEATAWDVAVNMDGSFLNTGMERFDFGGTIGFASGAGSSVGYQSNRQTAEDGFGFSITARYHYEGARYLGCQAIAEPGGPDVETLEELCQTIEADWSTVIANTPTPEVIEVATEAAMALIETPSPGYDREVVPVDDDSGRAVSIELPAGSSFSVDSFGSEVLLGGEYSIFTDFELDANCDGICSAQDWEAKLNGSSGQLSRTRLSITPENDIAIDSGWLLSGPSIGRDDYEIAVFRWDDRADHYFSCIVAVDADDRHRADELIGVCLTAEPNWFEG